MAGPSYVRGMSCVRCANRSQTKRCWLWGLASTKKADYMNALDGRALSPSDLDHGNYVDRLMMQRRILLPRWHGLTTPADLLEMQTCKANGHPSPFVSMRTRPLIDEMILRPGALRNLCFVLRKRCSLWSQAMWGLTSIHFTNLAKLHLLTLGLNL